MILIDTYTTCISDDVLLHTVLYTHKYYCTHAMQYVMYTYALDYSNNMSWDSFSTQVVSCL